MIRHPEPVCSPLGVAREGRRPSLCLAPTLDDVALVRAIPRQLLGADDRPRGLQDLSGTIPARLLQPPAGRQIGPLKLESAAPCAQDAPSRLADLWNRPDVHGGASCRSDRRARPGRPAGPGRRGWPRARSTAPRRLPARRDMQTCSRIPRQWPHGGHGPLEALAADQALRRVGGRLIALRRLRHVGLVAPDQPCRVGLGLAVVALEALAGLAMLWA